MATNETSSPPPAGDDLHAIGQGEGGGSLLAGDALDRFFVGALDEPRAASVRQYVDRSPAGRALFARLQAWLSRDDVMGQLPPADSSAAGLRAKIEAVRAGELPVVVTASAGGVVPAGSSPAFMHKLGVTGHPWRTWAFVAGGAASVVALLVTLSSTRPAAGPVERAYATTTGQRAVLTLDDGTRVTLAPRTTLRVARAGARARALTLDGEAFFEVARAADAPFVVRAGGVSTRVLGTAFLVSHYGADAGVRVAVSAGKVAVTTGGVHGPGVIVSAGRVAEVTDSGVTTGPAVDDGRYTGWLSGRLVFHKTPAEEVLATLSRWYGYEFRLADPALAQRRLTAGLSTQSSTAAFATLKLLLDVDLTFDGDVVTLTPHGARPARLDRGAARDTLTPYLQHEVGR